MIREVNRVIRYESMLQSDRDWLQKAVIEKKYWSLYFFCKFFLGYHDIIPTVHLLYAEFLDDDENQYKLALMPRDFIKSWILRGKMVLDYLRNPNERILLAMSTEDLVRNASEQIRAIMTRNELVRYVWPDLVPMEGSEDRWTIKAQTLPRTLDAPEATFTYAGVKTELVSGHFDRIYLDDIYAKEASESPESARKVFSFHAGCQALLNHPRRSTISLTATRWAVDDLSGAIMGDKKQFTDELVFRAEGDPRYVCLKRAAIENGEAIWPERFDLDVLAEMERGYENQGLGYFFAFQHLNNPIDQKVVEFPKQRQWTRGDGYEIKLHQPDGTFIIVDERHLYRTMTIDPAYTGKKRGDDCAICVIGSHPEGYRINLYSYVARITITEFREKILACIMENERKNMPLARVGMETNSQQLAAKLYIDEKARERKVYIPWYPLKTSPLASKEHRIRQMIPLCSEGMYYTHDRFHSANQEMKIFPASRKDNWLDAFSYQPQLWGVSSREKVVEEMEKWPGEFDTEFVTHPHKGIEGYGG
jgi:hypothetical protein